MDLKPLTDAVLLARLEALVCQERESVADVVEHLGEIDRRELIIDRGYTTLFDYCLKKLRYSEAGAFLRIRAARAANQFPRVLADLKSGAIHLDAVMRLYPYMSKENSDQLLDQAAGASKREVLAIVARLGGSNGAAERDFIRHIPSQAAHAQPVTKKISPESLSLSCISTASTPTPMPPADPIISKESEVLAPPSRIRLAFTADDQFVLMVEQLRRLRRHKFPAGRLEDLLKEAVSTLLERIDPNRKKSSAHRKQNGDNLYAGVEKHSRRIPAAIKTAVWKRDGGRCAYTAEDGLRCEGRDFLEYDHITPWALAGRSDSIENIRLLCRPHNQRLARRRFGPRRRAKPLPTASGRSR